MTNPTFLRKHPYWLSVLLALLCTFLTAAGSALPQVLSLDENSTYLVMASACFLSAFIGLLIMKFSGFSFREYGLRLPARESFRRVWFYLPLLLLEAVPFLFSGWDGAKNIPLLALFGISVGLNEEIYFRGIIRKLIGQTGRKKAVIWSAVIFGVLHSANLLGGAAPLNTLLQVAFAFLVGIVLAEIVFHTESLWIPILWHALHNFISFMAEDAADGRALTLLAVQVAILVIYSIVLWKRTCRENGL